MGQGRRAANDAGLGERWVELTVGESSGERVDAVEDDGACEWDKGVNIWIVSRRCACAYDGNEPAT